jgi:hypothetical protein
MRAQAHGARRGALAAACAVLLDRDMTVARARSTKPSSEEVPGADGFLPVRKTLPTLRDATVHPASVLRAPDDEMRRLAREELFHDFELVGDHFQQLSRAIA